MKRAITVLTAVMISILMGGSWAWATPTDPNADHKVTICHRTGSATGGELKNGYNEITVDIASSGYVKGGHTGHEQVGNGPGPDIIPAYEAFAKVKGQYEPFSFPGTGLDWVFEDGTTGAEFLANGCALNTPPEPVKTAASVDFFDPTCKNPDASLLSEFNPQEVTASLEGKVAPGEKVVVTFEAKEGFVLTTAAVWKHKFSKVPSNCGHENPVVKPYDKFSTECGSIDVVLGNKDKSTVAVTYEVWVDGKQVATPKVAPGTEFAKTYTFKEDSGKHGVTVTSEGEWVNTVFTETNCEKPETPNKPDQPGNPERGGPELPHTGANLALLGVALASIVGGAGLVGASRLTRSA